jgi:hypothetical protein
MHSIQEYYRNSFSTSLPFAPFFFTLAFLDMFWVCVVHVLGMLQVLRGM